MSNKRNYKEELNSSISRFREMQEKESSHGRRLRKQSILLSLKVDSIERFNNEDMLEKKHRKAAIKILTGLVRGLKSADETLTRINSVFGSNFEEISDDNKVIITPFTRLDSNVADPKPAEESEVSPVEEVSVEETVDEVEEEPVTEEAVEEEIEVEDVEPQITPIIENDESEEVKMGNLDNVSKFGFGFVMKTKDSILREIGLMNLSDTEKNDIAIKLENEMKLFSERDFKSQNVVNNSGKQLIMTQFYAPALSTSLLNSLNLNYSKEEYDEHQKVVFGRIKQIVNRIPLLFSLSGITDELEEIVHLNPSIVTNTDKSQRFDTIDFNWPSGDKNRIAEILKTPVKRSDSQIDKKITIKSLNTDCIRYKQELNEIGNRLSNLYTKSVFLKAQLAARKSVSQKPTENIEDYLELQSGLQLFDKSTEEIEAMVKENDLDIKTLTIAAVKCYSLLERDEKRRKYLVDELVQSGGNPGNMKRPTIESEYEQALKLAAPYIDKLSIAAGLYRWTEETPNLFEVPVPENYTAAGALNLLRNVCSNATVIKNKETFKTLTESIILLDKITHVYNLVLNRNFKKHLDNKIAVYLMLDQIDTSVTGKSIDSLHELDPLEMNLELSKRFKMAAISVFTDASIAVNK